MASGLADDATLAGAGGDMTPAGVARAPSGTSRRAHKGRGLAHQSRTWRDIRPQPAPCLPTHRYSCPLTAGHPQPDHDGGRRYRQRRRLEPLMDHNRGMARMAHHAAFRWQPDRARRCTLRSRSSARWQKSPLPATAWSGETSSIPAQSSSLAVLPSSESFLMQEKAMKHLPTFVAAVAMPFLVPRGHPATELFMLQRH